MMIIILIITPCMLASGIFFEEIEVYVLLCHHSANNDRTPRARFD